jgi:hypothetical protein
MKIEKTPEEQAKFDRMCIYFKFQARREYLRIQGTQISELLKLEQWCLDNQTGSEENVASLKKQQAELKEQWSELEKEYALVEIERLKALLNKQS